MDGSWTQNEFFAADLGDVRLKKRLITISERFAESPVSPINHACDNWAETKAAYRFFRNEKISYQEITKGHIAATKERCKEYSTVLAIQDTTFLNYTNHPQTEGLCPLSRKKGQHRENIVASGLIMHSTFAVTTDGLPLGIVAQKIYSRPQSAEIMNAKERSARNYLLPAQEKDGYKWLECLENTSKNLEDIKSRVITICDREADMYEIFLLADQLAAPLLIRANHNRTVNKKSPHSEITGEKLWGLLRSKTYETTIRITVPKQKEQEARTATCEVRFSGFLMNRPLNYVGKVENPPDLKLYAVYISEVDCPEGVEPIDWMLITNIPVENREQAREKAAWYCLRWRIETWHKVLKSGLQVEDCRLTTADRLIRYLAVMSIVAWRIFWLTLVVRIAPTAPCQIFLKDFEWKILNAKFNKIQKQKNEAPTLEQATTWIAQLGGFLARKGDKQPGITHMWRGLKKFSAMLEGAALARGICG